MNLGDVFLVIMVISLIGGIIQQRRKAKKVQF